MFWLFSRRISVGILKNISAKLIFQEHPEVKREHWGGKFWEDGFFVRTGGAKVKAEVIRNYITIIVSMKITLSN